MSRRKNPFLLDNCVVHLKQVLGNDRCHSTTECGLSADADDIDVIDLAFQEADVLVTENRHILRKARDYQTQRRGHCLYGLLLLPSGIEIQRRIVAGILSGRWRVHYDHYDRPVTVADVRSDNLALRAREDGSVFVEELCDCDWEDD